MKSAGRKPAKKPAARKAAGNGEYSAPSEYLWNGVTLSMPDSPLTPAPEGDADGIPRLVADDEYRKKALSSMRGFLELADRIERMDGTLKQFECVWIAGAVRAYASQISLSPPRKVGAKVKLSPVHVVARYIELRRDKHLGQEEAITEVADEMDASVPGVKKVLKKYRDQADQWAEAFYIPNLKFE